MSEVMPRRSFLPVRPGGDHVSLISTHDAPSGNRLAYWREAYASRFIGCAIDANSDEPFWSELAAVRLGPVTLGSIAGSAKVSSTDTSGSDSLVVNVPLLGSCLCEQSGRGHIVEPGQGFVYHDGLAARQTSESVVEYCTFKIEGAMVIGRLGDPERFAGTRLTSDTPELRVLLAYVSALAHAGDLSEASVRTMIGNHIVDLIVSALAQMEKRETPGLARSLRAARLAAIKRLIEAAYVEPMFDVRRAAQRANLSERYIQKLFEETGVTFSEYLLEKRLCRARNMLLDRANDGQRIQEIAWATGFSDISTFNRQFRRRFGERPSDARAR